jgi:hypothetical protein
MMLVERPESGDSSLPPPGGATELPPRAVTARLTLQLRAARRDVEVAEEAEVAADAEVARQQLRDRLNPMLDDRRRVLHQALVAEQAEAAELVADAHRQVAESNGAPVELMWAPEAPSSADDLLANVSSNLASHIAVSLDPTAGLDPAAMATLFTSVAGRMLDERLERLVPLPEPKKPSFWKHVFHPDVVIVGLIMIFCLIVVASWMS